MRSFLLNRVILNTLAEIDFLSLLTLTTTSWMFHDYIYENVVTKSIFCRFMRKNQYTLYHDTFRTPIFSHDETLLLIRAFEVLQHRHGESFYYDDIRTLVGLLLAHVPLKAFQKSGFPSDWSLQIKNDELTMEHVDNFYYNRFKTSWMHRFPRFVGITSILDVLHPYHETISRRYLRQDFLFCKYYIDDIITCAKIGNPWPSKSRSGKNIPAIIQSIREESRENNLPIGLEKHCLQGYLIKNFTDKPMSDDQSRENADIFEKLFAKQEWLDLWENPELGFWCALGMTQWGPESVESLIKTVFCNRRECLLWLFLGAHGWYDDYVLYRDDPETEAETYCCSPMAGRERQFIRDELGSLSRGDRIWLVRRILELAPEYGVCRHLGGNIFNYFVCNNREESDIMLAELLEGFVGSRLQYIFEFAISVAIGSYRNRGGECDFIFELSRKYACRLLRKDLELYEILSI
jgi:hypothetical protein